MRPGRLRARELLRHRSTLNLRMRPPAAECRAVEAGKRRSGHAVPGYEGGDAIPLRLGHRGQAARMLDVCVPADNLKLTCGTAASL